MTYFPRLIDRYTLRRVEDVFYLMDPKTGDYYELDDIQYYAFKMADGSKSVEEIARALELPLEELTEFYEEQAEFVEMCESANQISPHCVECKGPHLSDVLIEVTGRCNLYCKHCFNSKYNSEEYYAENMTKEELLSLIDVLDQMNVRRIQLSGGEPLTREDLSEIIEAIDTHKMFLDVISTNGTLIDEDNIRYFSERFGENGALYISLDGISRETYEGLRGEDTFNRIMHAMDLLTQHGCRVFINTMAYKYNLDELESMYDWISARPNIIGWRIGLPKVLGRYEENHKHLEVSFDKVILIFKRILSKWISENGRVRLELSDFFRTDSLDVGFETHSLEDHPCKYALTNATIKSNGDVVYCASLGDYPDAQFGNIRENGLKACWDSEKHLAFRQLKIKDIPECIDCRYLRICGGGCRSNALLSYGSIYRADPRACIAMNMLEHEIVPLLSEMQRTMVMDMIDLDGKFNYPSGYKKYI